MSIKYKPSTLNHQVFGEIFTIALKKGVQDSPLASGLGFWGFRIWGLGLRVWGLGS